MTFGYLQCPCVKGLEQQIFILLCVLLQLPVVTDNSLSDISFDGSNYEGILQRQHICGNIYSALYLLHYSYTDTEKPTSFPTDLLSNRVCFTLTLETDYLQLSFALNVTPNTSLSGFLIKDNYTKNYHIETGISQIYVLLTGDLHKPSLLIITMIHFIYQYQQSIWLRKTSQIQEFKDEREESEESDQRQTLPTFVIVAISALVISTVMVFFTNSFIILALGLDSAKARNINPKELILFTLGLFNITFQCTMVANDTLLFLWRDLYYSDYIYTIFSILLLFTIFSSFWFTFCLCGFYYVMLVTFQKTLFMHLKQNISRIVPWLLFSCMSLSIVISIPVAWNIKKVEYFELLDGNMTGNVTTHLSPPYMSLQYLLVTSIIGCCIPLILVAIANVLIVRSLWSHITHLRKSSGGIYAQSLEASISAARTVTSLLLLYISFYVSETLLIMDVFKVDSPWISVCLITVYSYAPLQSVILISGSPNLREKIKTMICPCTLTKDMSSGCRTDTNSSTTSLNTSLSLHRMVET